MQEDLSLGNGLQRHNLLNVSRTAISLRVSSLFYARLSINLMDTLNQGDGLTIDFNATMKDIEKAKKQGAKVHTLDNGVLVADSYEYFLVYRAENNISIKSKTNNFNDTLNRLKIKRINLDKLEVTSNICNMLYHADIDTLVLNIKSNKLRTMADLFIGAHIKTLSFKGFKDTGTIVNFSSTFKGAEIDTIDFTGANIKSVTHLGEMFKGAKIGNIINLDHISDARLINTIEMFKDAIIDKVDLSKWNLKSLQYNGSMFCNCKINELNLSGISPRALTGQQTMLGKTSHIFHNAVIEKLIINEKAYNELMKHSVLSDAFINNIEVHKEKEQNKIMGTNRPLGIKKEEMRLLIIDMQNAYMPGGVWECQCMKEVAGNVVKLEKAWEEKLGTSGILNTAFITASKPLGTWKAYAEKYKDVTNDRYANEVISELKHLKVIEKSTYSAFFNKEVREAVSKQKPVVICGVVADCCVLATVMSLIDAGNPIIYIEDAIGHYSDDSKNYMNTLMKNMELHITIMKTDEFIRDYI